MSKHTLSRHYDDKYIKIQTENWGGDEVTYAVDRPADGAQVWFSTVILKPSKGSPADDVVSVCGAYLDPETATALGLALLNAANPQG
jgi:hypothetical protein